MAFYVANNCVLLSRVAVGRSISLKTVGSNRNSSLVSIGAALVDEQQLLAIDRHDLHLLGVESGR